MPLLASTSAQTQVTSCLNAQASEKFVSSHDRLIQWPSVMCKRNRASRVSANGEEPLTLKRQPKKNTFDEHLNPEDTPTNVPGLGKSSEDANVLEIEEPGKATIHPDYETGSYMGPSQAEDPYLNQFLDQDAERGYIPFVTRATRMVDNNVAFTIYTRDCNCDADVRALYESKWNKLSCLVEPYRDQLLALFFRFIDWTFPAVDKKRFYRSYFHHEPPLNRGLVTAMLGLGVTYWKYSTQLCVKPIPPNLTSELWRLSWHYIEHDINCSGPTLDTVQALLLFTQRRLAGDGMHEQIASRMHIGMLVSMSYSLGLHLDCSHWDIGDTEKSSRKRLSALVYYVDQWTAANLGHPALLARGSESNLPHEYQSQWRQERRFVQLIKVTNILSEVLSQLYGSTGVSNILDATEITMKTSSFLSHCNQLAYKAETLENNLRAWRASLPEELGNMKARNSLRYCSNGMLHLSALAVEVLIFRVLILPCYNGRYRHEARDLVQRIITFCLEINHPHLNAFWISPCRLSLASLTHFVLRYHAQSPPSERKKNTPLMRSWMECLRSLSNGWEEGIGLAHHRMDALFYKGQTSLNLPLTDQTILATDANELNSAFNLSNVMTHERFDKQFREEPLTLEEEFMSPPLSDESVHLLLADETLHGILRDIIWD